MYVGALHSTRTSLVALATDIDASSRRGAKRVGVPNVPIGFGSTTPALFLANLNPTVQTMALGCF